MKLNTNSLGENAAVEVKELDWGVNHNSFTESYDIIIGSDIIYIEETFQQLLTTILYLCKENTSMLLSCRNRYRRDDQFLDTLSAHFQVKKVLYDKSRDIYIYEVRKYVKSDL